MADNGKNLTALLIVLILGSYGFTATVALILWNKSEQIVKTQADILSIATDIAEVKAASSDIKKMLNTQGGDLRDTNARLERIERPLKAYIK